MVIRAWMVNFGNASRNARKKMETRKQLGHDILAMSINLLASCLEISSSRALTLHVTSSAAVL